MIYAEFVVNANYKLGQFSYDVETIWFTLKNCELDNIYSPYTRVWLETPQYTVSTNMFLNPVPNQATLNIVQKINSYNFCLCVMVNVVP